MVRWYDTISGWIGLNVEESVQGETLKVNEQLLEQMLLKIEWKL